MVRLMCGYLAEYVYPVSFDVILCAMCHQKNVEYCIVANSSTEAYAATMQCHTTQMSMLALNIGDVGG